MTLPGLDASAASARSPSAFQASSVAGLKANTSFASSSFAFAFLSPSSSSSTGSSKARCAGSGAGLATGDAAAVAFEGVRTLGAPDAVRSMLLRRGEGDAFK